MLSSYLGSHFPDFLHVWAAFHTLTGHSSFLNWELSTRILYCFSIGFYLSLLFNGLQNELQRKQLSLTFPLSPKGLKRVWEWKKDFLRSLKVFFVLKANLLKQKTLAVPAYHFQNGILRLQGGEGDILISFRQKNWDKSQVSRITWWRVWQIEQEKANLINVLN